MQFIPIGLPDLYNFWVCGQVVYQPMSMIGTAFKETDVKNSLDGCGVLIPRKEQAHGFLTLCMSLTVQILTCLHQTTCVQSYFQNINRQIMVVILLRTCCVVLFLVNWCSFALQNSWISKHLSLFVQVRCPRRPSSHIVTRFVKSASQILLEAVRALLWSLNPCKHLMSFY